ncbi:hypothetical protein ESCO_006173 [Escovopsis weberi]|uniref:Heterokaryon incompatibility domain-containing protein n=1 Tax=Escovopsis weberi TaxID=150374 RepID=A0A0M8MV93_ESCWE|nr:hypothetical protein ESCO_006173 [Escovopsis weberi]
MEEQPQDAAQDAAQDAVPGGGSNLEHQPSLEKLPSDPPKLEHKPLPQGSPTRLVTIKAGVGRAPLQISLAPLQLDDVFDLLSWYSPESETKCKVSAQEGDQSGYLVVEPTLENALLGLRLPDAPRKIWVYELCINTSDSLEWADAIDQMARVYDQTRGVLIWLPLASPDYIAQLARDLPKLRTLRDIMTFPRAGGAFFDLISQPYFSSRWAIEHIVLAKKVTIMASPVDTLDWDHLLGLAHLLHTFYNTFFTDMVTLEMPESVFRAIDMFNGSDLWALCGLVSKLSQLYVPGRRGVAKLEALLFLSHRFKTRVGHDCVYSLLRLASDVHQAGKNHFPPFVIDYKRSPLQLSQYIIHWLVMADHGRTDVILRPWARPDASVPGREELSYLKTKQIRRDVLHYPTITQRMLIGAPDAPLFSASGVPGDKNLDNIPFFIDNVMIVRGFVVDKVGIVNRPARKTGRIDQSWARFAGWNDWQKAPPRDFWQTLVAGRDFAGRPLTSDEQPNDLELDLVRVCQDKGASLSLAERWAKFRFYRRCPREQLKVVEKIRDMQSKKGMWISFWTEMTFHGTEASNEFLKEKVRQMPISTIKRDCTYRSLVNNTTMGRKLFLTFSMGLMGLGPDGIRLGDSICIIGGCTVPVILREKEGKPGIWTIIGECYIDGLMEGEALSPGRKWRSFSIE